MMSDDLEVSFKEAKDKMNKLPKDLPSKTRGQLWRLYKQATYGDYIAAKVGEREFVAHNSEEERIKRDGWGALKGMAKEEAKRQYVALANTVKG